MICISISLMSLLLLRLPIFSYIAAYNIYVFIIDTMRSISILISIFSSTVGLSNLSIMPCKIYDKFYFISDLKCCTIFNLILSVIPKEKSYLESNSTILLSVK
jgi:hypothetical protein